MIVLVNALQAKKADEETIRKGTPSLTLMERAGRAAFLAMKPMIKRGSRILVLCGSGGNGGDGYVLARHLAEEGADVTVLPASLPKTAECVLNAERYKGPLCEAVKGDYDVYVDALFGTGLARDIGGRERAIIEQINARQGCKVAIDVPSGLDATTGLRHAVAFDSDVVLTVQFLKLGFFLWQGRIGKIQILEIGLDLSGKEKLPRFVPLEERALLQGEVQRARRVRMEDLVRLCGKRKEEILPDLPFYLEEARKKEGRPVLLLRDRYDFLADETGLSVFDGREGVVEKKEKRP